MNKTKILLAAFCLLCVAFLWSCSKPNTPAPQKFTGCRVSRIKEVGHDTAHKTFYNFFYNNDGTVQRIYVTYGQYMYQSYTRYFNYHDHYIKTRSMYLGNTYVFAQDSVLIDSAKRITGVFHIDNYNYNNYTNSWDLYNYDNAGNMTLHTHHLMNSENTDTFHWAGGDITRWWEGSTDQYYEYAYLSQAYNTGNITALLADMELYGRPIYTPAHPWTSSALVGYDTIMLYSYEWDSTGKITRVKEYPKGPGGISYYKDSWITYECQ